MFLIAGLGNPGDEYIHTRHNTGFDALDILADRYGITIRTPEFRAMTGKGRIEGMPVILVKPLTYMNLSGESIGQVLHYYKLDPSTDMVVLSDDINLDCGVIRIRKGGSAGGHNGLKNIIKCCGTDAFPRIRIGAGKLPAGGDMVKHVLGRPTGPDRERMEQGMAHAAEAAVLVMQGEIEEAMNRYNGWRPE